MDAAQKAFPYESYLLAKRNRSGGAIQSIDTAAPLSTEQHKVTHQEENIAAHPQQAVPPASVRRSSPWHGQPRALLVIRESGKCEIGIKGF